MMTNLKSRFARSCMRLGLCLLIIAAAASGLARIALAVAIDGSDQSDVQCDPILLLLEGFKSVPPPVLPAGCSSPTWVTSNSGVPTPPADTLPNAALIDDPATISDMQLFSPNIVYPAVGGRGQLLSLNN